MPRAPKLCNSPEGCTALVHDGSGRCPQHQRRSGKWDAKKGYTNRTATTEHKKRRTRILKRDPLCTLAYDGICTKVSTVCDHAIPLAAAQLVGLTVAQLDTDDMCQGACEPCSRSKTAREAHYVAGHRVDCPWSPDAVARARRQPSADRPSSSRVPRTIAIARY
jgi:5-methylcytosine-specific restriction enzyme A